MTIQKMIFGNFVLTHSLDKPPTSKMRQAQDDEIRLGVQKRQQLQNFAMTKRRLEQTGHMLNGMVSYEAKPIKSILREVGHKY